MKEQILAAALRMAARKGLTNVTRQDIATAAGTATGTVTYHLGEMRKIRAAIVAKAIEDRNLVVVGQALAINHPLALKAPDFLKKQAAHALAQH